MGLGTGSERGAHRPRAAPATPRLGYGTVMHPATPVHGAPCRASGDRAVPHHVAPCHSMWDHGMPCYVTHTMWHHAGWEHATPHGTTSRHAGPCHITPHHVVPAQSTGHVASAGIYRPSRHVSQPQAHPRSHCPRSLPRPWAGLLAMGTHVLLLQPVVTLVPGQLCGDSPSEDPACSPPARACFPMRTPGVWRYVR